MAKQSMRVEYGRHLVKLGGKYHNLIALEADLKESTQSLQFQEAYPKRYIEVGVAEQNMIGIAAGLALAGKIPVTHSFACFTSLRACEQIRTAVAYPKLNVKFVATHSGLSAGSAGTTHHAIEDIAIMRSIPNMAVLVPGDIREMQQAVEAALEHDGPVYIRLGAGDAEDIYKNDDKFCIGKATELRSGNDIAIITTGTMVYEGVTVSERLLKESNIKARVLQMASLKPIDRDAIIKAAQETGHIVTIEEHNIIGGLGGAVCEVAAEIGSAKIKRIGINDRFFGAGSYSYLMKQEGLFVENIVRIILRFLKKEEVLA